MNAAAGYSTKQDLNVLKVVAVTELLYYRNKRVFQNRTIKTIKQKNRMFVQGSP